MDCIEALDDAYAEHEALQAEEMRSQTARPTAAGPPMAGGRRKARVVGRLDRADDGPGWRHRMKPL